MANEYMKDDTEALYSGANDVVVVEQEGGILQSSPLHVFVGKLENMRTLFQSRKDKTAEIHVNNIKVHGIIIELGDSGAAYVGKSEPSCRLTHSHLENMKLKNGLNKARLIIEDLDVSIPFSIYLFNQDSKLILTDIDGTITKSDVRGFIGGYLELDVHHDGVIEFLDKVRKNGYNIIYLTARPIAFDLETRQYLFRTLKHSDAVYRMPEQPLFLTPAVLTQVAMDNAAEHTEAKTATLRSLMELFKLRHNVVLGAYGNKNSDTEAYLNIGISRDRIFIINKQSKMTNVGTGQDTSYKQHANSIDKMYPAV